MSDTSDNLRSVLQKNATVILCSWLVHKESTPCLFIYLITTPKIIISVPPLHKLSHETSAIIIQTSVTLTATCSQGCVNGVCTSTDVCTCDIGWTGSSCETEVTSSGLLHLFLIHARYYYVTPQPHAVKGVLMVAVRT